MAKLGCGFNYSNLPKLIDICLAQYKIVSINVKNLPKKQSLGHSDTKEHNNIPC